MTQAPTINIRGKLISLREPKVMGIINVTPDSFYAGSRAQAERGIAERAERIVQEGGDIIDIGAFSTRPGAAWVSEEEETERLRRALAIVRRRQSEAIVSIDSFRPAVIRMAYEEYGIDIINDVSGGNPGRAFGGRADSGFLGRGIGGEAMDATGSGGEGRGSVPGCGGAQPISSDSGAKATDDDEESVPEMFRLAAEIGIPYILMSSKPTVETILRDFARRTRQLRSVGVKDIILDPGFGFGKSLVENYQLLRKLDRIGIMQMPVMAAVSRKSMLYNLLHSDAAHALNATTAANAIALMGGASILRVHDVKEAVETVKIVTQTLHPDTANGGI